MPYEVGVKIGKLQQHRDVRTSRCSNVVTLQRAAETQHPDVTTFGIGFGSIFSPFGAHVWGFKAQTRETQGVTDFGRF